VIVEAIEISSSLTNILWMDSVDFGRFYQQKNILKGELLFSENMLH